MAKLVLQPSCHFYSYLLRCCMRTYDAWFPRYALRNRLMFFVNFSCPPWDEEVPHCPLFLPAACKGLIIVTFLAKFQGSRLGTRLNQGHWSQGASAPPPNFCEFFAKSPLLPQVLAILYLQPLHFSISPRTFKFTLTSLLTLKTRSHDTN